MAFETAVKNEGIRDDRDRDPLIGPAERRFDIVHGRDVFWRKRSFAQNVGMAFIKAVAGFYADHMDVFTLVEGGGSRLEKGRRLVSDIFCCEGVAAQRVIQRMLFWDS